MFLRWMKLAGPPSPARGRVSTVPGGSVCGCRRWEVRHSEVCLGVGWAPPGFLLPQPVSRVAQGTRIGAWVWAPPGGPLPAYFPVQCWALGDTWCGTCTWTLRNILRGPISPTSAIWGCSPGPWGWVTEASRLPLSGGCTCPTWGPSQAPFNHLGERWGPVLAMGAVKGQEGPGLFREGSPG